LVSFYDVDIFRHDLAPFPCLFLDAADSEFADFIAAALEMLRVCPNVVAMVESDLDSHAKKKKALRLADARWAARESGRLPHLDDSTRCGPEAITLGDGRPRTPALVVALYLLLRGYVGGFKSAGASDLLAESRTLAVFLARVGLAPLGRSTLTELTNAVSARTRTALLDAQICMVTREALDDFSTLIVDSTSVAGNTEWPTESRLVVKLLGRILHVGHTLPKFGLPELFSYEAARIHDRLVKIDRDIDMLKSGKNLTKRRKRRYKKVIGTGRAAYHSVTNELPVIRRALAALKAPPSRRERAERVVARIESDLADLARVLGHCEARIVDQVKVPAAEKVVSTSDPDAAFIVKGQRDPRVGYKPQLARSGNGFVTGLIVPRGNAADSDMLVPMYEQVLARTKVTPERVIVDDGYASAANRNALRQRGVGTISIGGSKGRKLTPAKEWSSDEHVAARDDRSAVESLMSTLKGSFDFDALSRRGLDAATAELMEKVLAYNLCRMVALRAARRRALEARALAA
jgi:hypothetical protein